MSGNGSPTGPKMVDAGKAAVVEDVGTSATAQGSLEAAHPLLRRFIADRDAAFRAAPSAKQPDRFRANPGDRATPPLMWSASTLGD
eukprot:jgi/Tetstr1/445423/TSEL_033205.t1